MGDSCQAGTCEGIRSGTLATSFAGPCAIRSGGDVYCWGNAPTTSPSSNGAPSRIDLPLPAVSVSVGGVHACAVLTDGSTRCWGSNQQGTLGNGTLEPVTGAVRPDLANVVQVDSSPFQTAALTGDGTVSLWGAANAVRVATNISLYGSEAPPSSTQQVTTPFPIARLGQVVSLGLGQSHMCAALSNGQVVCWGRSDRAQLGRPSAGGEDVQPSPGLVDLAGADDATAVDVGEGYSCALRASGRVVCWGSLFATDLWGSDVPPTEVPGLSDAIQVSVGAGSACALRSSRTVACWGSNLFGSLGNGTFVDSESAQPVANLTDAVLLGAASASARSFCALRSGGQVVCWGANSEGALGDGTTTNRPTPVPVLGLPD